MVTVYEAIVLGIIQGITEWFPISSSGHLVLGKHFLGLKQDPVFDVALHFGSLLVILIVFRKDIYEIFLGLMAGEKKYRDIVLQLFLATLPIAIIGVLFNDFIKSLFNIRTVGYSLLFTGFVLFMSRLGKNEFETNYSNTFNMGLMQALALLPGVSRSGITISAGLLQGINSRDAARFSFLLAVPAILGANILEIRNLSQLPDIQPLVIGIFTTVITGLLALKSLLFIIKKNKFSYFSVYCIILGTVILVVL